MAIAVMDDAQSSHAEDVAPVAGPLTPVSGVLSLAEILSAVHEGRLRSPLMARGFVWSRTHVLALWKSLYAGWFIGEFLTRAEEVGRLLSPITTPLATDGEADAVPATAGVTGLYDGLNRLGCLSMTAFARSIWRRDSEASVSWRVAFDPFDGTFHRPTRQLLTQQPHILPDISLLFRASDGGEVDAVVCSHLMRMRNAGTRIGVPVDGNELARAEIALRRLRAVLNRYPVSVVAMPAGASDQEALKQMFYANGVYDWHR